MKMTTPMSLSKLLKASNKTGNHKLRKTILWHLKWLMVQQTLWLMRVKYSQCAKTQVENSEHKAKCRLLSDIRYANICLFLKDQIIYIKHHSLLDKLEP